MRGWATILAAFLCLACLSHRAQADLPGVEHVVALGPGTLRDLDDGQQTTIRRLPHRGDLSPRTFRQFSLEVPFQIPDTTVSSLWAIYFLTLNEGGRVTLNGKAIGEVPTSTVYTAVLNIRPYMFTIPPELLRDGPNLLSLQWATHDSMQHLSAAFVGPADVVRSRYERRIFWQNTMAQVGFDFAIVSAAIMLGIFALRRNEPRYLLMGLTSLGWANVCMAYFLPAMPASLYPYWHLVRLTGIATVACCAWLFLMLEVDPADRVFKRLCIGWAVLGPAGYFFNYALYDSIFNSTFEGTWGGVMVALGTYPMFHMGRGLLRHWTWRRGIFLLATLAGLLAGAADIAMSSTGSGLFSDVGYTAQAVSPIWAGAIVIVLVRDFADSFKRERELNQSMAARLQQQEVQLRELHAKDQLRQRERATFEERQRIMQDIHDGLGSQLVSSLALSERGALDARQTSALLRECIDDLRLAIDSLAASDDSFAVMAGNLRFRMAPRLRAAGITLRWNSAGLGDADGVDGSKALPLLRIMQESLSNALRHSGASEITVTLTTSDDGLRIRIHDDGRGFDAAQVRFGKGIGGMEKRARAIGARLTIVQDLGTTVELALPTRR